jgi:hypothetical protein
MGAGDFLIVMGRPDSLRLLDAMARGEGAAVAV